MKLPTPTRYRRMRDALQTIGTDCRTTTNQQGERCPDNPRRKRDGYYGDERWCDGCIAREGLA